MGGDGRQLRTGANESPFPQVVAWISLGLALLVFFSNTVPAVKEREALEADAERLRVLRDRYDQALDEQLPATPGATSAEEDLQTVLVAIDRIGWTPDELRQSFPPPAADAAAGDRLGTAGRQAPAAPEGAAAAGDGDAR